MKALPLLHAQCSSVPGVSLRYIIAFVERLVQKSNVSSNEAARFICLLLLESNDSATFDNVTEGW